MTRSVLYTCIYTAWLRVSYEYRKLKIGYLWEILSLVFIVSFLTLIWGRVLKNTSAGEYFFYVLLGFNAWSLMSRCISQCISFRNRTFPEMKRGSTNLRNQFLINMIYCHIQFLFSFPFVIIASIIYFGFSLVSLFGVVAAISCIFITGYALFSTLGLLIFFYQDVRKLIEMIMRVAFLMTPVLWSPEMLGDDIKDLVYLNPFYCYLDVYRTSLMSHTIPISSFAIMLSITLLLHLIGQFVTRQLESKVLVEIFLKRNAN